MSWIALDWAETAPVASPFEWIILNMMAARADIDGEGIYLSPATMARRSKIDEQTVKRHMRELEARRIIGKGDPSRAAHIPANRRPIVYDLLIPASDFSSRQWDEVQKFRAEQGRSALTAECRPDIAEPGATRKRRADLGVPRAPRQDDGVQPMTADDPEPADRGMTNMTGQSQGGLRDTPTAGGSTRYPQGGLRDPQIS